MSILAHVSVGHLGISGIGWAWLQAAGQVQVLSMSLSSSLDRIATAYFSHGKHTFNCYYIISTDIQLPYASYMAKVKAKLW